jgi:hypothetical protein
MQICMVIWGMAGGPRVRGLWMESSRTTTWLYWLARQDFEDSAFRSVLVWVAGWRPLLARLVRERLGDAAAEGLPSLIPPPSYLEEQFRLQHSGSWRRRQLAWPPPCVSPRRTGGWRHGRLPAPRVAKVGNGVASLPEAEAGEAVFLPNDGGQRGHHSRG